MRGFADQCLSCRAKQKEPRRIGFALSDERRRKTQIAAERIEQYSRTRGAEKLRRDSV